MLYDLDWLDAGQKFPPASQSERLERYETGLKLFDSKHAEVYGANLARISKIIANFDDVIDYPVILNYNRLLSLKTADLVCGEPPIIRQTDGGGTLVDEVTAGCGLHPLLFESVIDISRFGDAVWRVYLDAATGKGKLACVYPGHWFPVVSRENHKEVVSHVIARVYEEGKRQYLVAQIHTPGKFELRRYAFRNGVIGALEHSGVSPTGLPHCAVIHVPGVTTSDSLFGHDDYSHLDSILSELCVRLGQIGRVLDRHADPSLQGPRTALTQDPASGRYKLVLGNYFARDEGSGDVSYITWDGQLDAAFRQVDMLVEQLLILSEMGAALAGTGVRGSFAESGAALRLRMTNPMIKARRVAMSLTGALKRALATVARLGYGELDERDIDITWQDGLPDDAAAVYKLT